MWSTDVVLSGCGVCDMFVFQLHGGYNFGGCEMDMSGNNYDSAWTNSRCIMLNATVPYDIYYCNATNATDIPLHANNTIYTPSGHATFQCGGDSLTLEQWQALGLDSGTTEAKTPGVEQVIQWASDILYLKSGYGVEAERAHKASSAVLDS